MLLNVPDPRRMVLRLPRRPVVGVLRIPFTMAPRTPRVVGRVSGVVTLVRPWTSGLSYPERGREQRRGRRWPGRGPNALHTVISLHAAAGKELRYLTERLGDGGRRRRRLRRRRTPLPERPSASYPKLPPSNEQHEWLAASDPAPVRSGRLPARQPEGPQGTSRKNPIRRPARAASPAVTGVRAGPDRAPPARPLRACGGRGRARPHRGVSSTATRCPILVELPVAASVGSNPYRLTAIRIGIRRERTP